MSSQQHQAISVELCREWRNRYERGRSVGQIAEHYGHGKTTVRRHVHDRCSHAVADGEWGTNGGTPCPLCGDAYEASNLPNHLADCPAHDVDQEAAANRGESA